MLKLRHTILYIIYALLYSSCITPFDPEIEPEAMANYAVNGQVSDMSEIQTISVSRASSIIDPQYLPVTGCNVVIRDDLGNTYQLNDVGNGNYSGLIGRSNLIPGRSFMVEILTRDGVEIESDFDKMYECPDVDTVYYQRKDIISTTPGEEVIKGIQFYLDIDVRNLNSHYFRWELIETFEYQARFPREWYYDGTVHHILPVDYSRKYCWSTLHVKGIYTLSTDGLISNSYERVPLNFVDNISSPRLAYGYNLVIIQHALSESAYSYWENVRINLEQGGLYEKQPISISGNLHNITNPENEVLGFFGVSSSSSERIYVRKVPYLENEFVPFCTPVDLRFGFYSIDPREYPAFLYGDQAGYLMIKLSPACVDCLVFGGTNVRPDYWPHSYE